MRWILPLILLTGALSSNAQSRKGLILEAVSLEYWALESRIRFAHAAGYDEELWELRRESSDLYWRLECLRDGDQHAWRDVEYALVWTRPSDALRRIEGDLDARRDRSSAHFAATIALIDIRDARYAWERAENYQSTGD